MGRFYINHMNNWSLLQSWGFIAVRDGQNMKATLTRGGVVLIEIKAVQENIQGWTIELSGSLLKKSELIHARRILERVGEILGVKL